MAKAAVASGALLSTVTNMANMVSNTFATIDDTISIGNGFISRHKIMQQDKNIVELANARVRLVEDTALEMAQHRQEINAKLKDETFKASYEDAHKSLSALFGEAE